MQFIIAHPLFLQTLDTQTVFVESEMYARKMCKLWYLQVFKSEVIALFVHFRLSLDQIQSVYANLGHFYQ